MIIIDLSHIEENESPNTISMPIYCDEDIILFVPHGDMHINCDIGTTKNLYIVCKKLVIDSHIVANHILFLTHGLDLSYRGTIKATSLKIISQEKLVIDPNIKSNMPNPMISTNRISTDRLQLITSASLDIFSTKNRVNTDLYSLGFLKQILDTKNRVKQILQAQKQPKLIIYRNLSQMKDSDILLECATENSYIEDNADPSFIEALSLELELELLSSCKKIIDSRNKHSKEIIEAEIGYDRYLEKLKQKRDMANTQYNLAKIYHKGWGIEQNPNKAMRCFESALQQGLLEARDDSSLSRTAFYLTGSAIPLPNFHVEPINNDIQNKMPILRIQTPIVNSDTVVLYYPGTHISIEAPILAKKLYIVCQDLNIKQDIDVWGDIWLLAHGLISAVNVNIASLEGVIKMVAKGKVVIDTEGSSIIFATEFRIASSAEISLRAPEFNQKKYYQQRKIMKDSAEHKKMHEKLMDNLTCYRDPKSIHHKYRIGKINASVCIQPKVSIFCYASSYYASIADPDTQTVKQILDGKMLEILLDYFEDKLLREMFSLRKMFPAIVANTYETFKISETHLPRMRQFVLEEKNQRPENMLALAELHNKGIMFDQQVQMAFTYVTRLLIQERERLSKSLFELGIKPRNAKACPPDLNEEVYKMLPFIPYMQEIQFESLYRFLGFLRLNENLLSSIIEECLLCEKTNWASRVYDLNSEMVTPEVKLALASSLMVMDSREDKKKALSIALALEERDQDVSIKIMAMLCGEESFADARNSIRRSKLSLENAKQAINLEKSVLDNLLHITFLNLKASTKLKQLANDAIGRYGIPVSNNNETSKRVDEFIKVLSEFPDLKMLMDPAPQKSLEGKEKNGWLSMPERKFCLEPMQKPNPFTIFYYNLNRDKANIPKIMLIKESFQKPGIQKYRLLIVIAKSFCTENSNLDRTIKNSSCVLASYVPDKAEHEIVRQAMGNSELLASHLCTPQTHFGISIQVSDLTIGEFNFLCDMLTRNGIHLPPQIHADLELYNCYKPIDKEQMDLYRQCFTLNSKWQEVDFNILFEKINHLYIMDSKQRNEQYHSDQLKLMRNKSPIDTLYQLGLSCCKVAVQNPKVAKDFFKFAIKALSAIPKDNLYRDKGYLLAGCIYLFEIKNMLSFVNSGVSNQNLADGDLESLGSLEPESYAQEADHQDLLMNLYKQFSLIIENEIYEKLKPNLILMIESFFEAYAWMELMDMNEIFEHIRKSTLTGSLYWKNKNYITSANSLLDKHYFNKMNILTSAINPMGSIHPTTNNIMLPMFPSADSQGSYSATNISFPTAELPPFDFQQVAKEFEDYIGNAENLLINSPYPIPAPTMTAAFSLQQTRQSNAAENDVRDCNDVLSIYNDIISSCNSNPSRGLATPALASPVAGTTMYPAASTNPRYCLQD